MTVSNAAPDSPAPETRADPVRDIRDYSDEEMAEVCAVIAAAWQLGVSDVDAER